VPPETLAAWHVYKEAAHSDVKGGKNKVNHWSLGIEVVNAQTTADTFSDWQVAVTAKIVRYCWAKYPNLRHLVSHAKLDSQFRSDPGTKFTWQKFKNLVLSSDQQAAFATLIAATRNADDISPGAGGSLCCFYAHNI
jgi:N-acetylmuramoyl-L-alanine amidase